MNTPHLHTQTLMTSKMIELFEKLEIDFKRKRGGKIVGYLAGGMAIHMYTGERVTTDIDIELTEKVFIPDDLVVEIKSNGNVDHLYIDKNYNSTFALLHPDYKKDSIKTNIKLKFFDIHLLNPVDLVVSKISRFAQNDQEDIKALAKLGVVSHQDVEKRANEAMDYFVGNLDRLKYNLKDAIELIKKIELKTSKNYKF